MANTSQRVEVNNFVKGLITEASPINFPANASLDEENFELNRDGTRDRRLGLDYEPNAVLRETPTPFSVRSPADYAYFEWDSVGGNADTNFLVVQSNKFLMFFDKEALAVSGDGYKGTAWLAAFPDDVSYSFTSSEGRLIVAGGHDTIAIVSYVSGGMSVEYEALKVRDLWGVEETSISQYESDISYRGLVSEQHTYNLQNQSWGIPRKNATGTLSDPLSLYNTAFSVYPSNSEAVWPGLQFQPVSGATTPYERVFTNLYQEALGAEGSAAKGYYIIELLRRGVTRSNEFINNVVKYPTLSTPFVTLKQDTTTGGATVVAEFAGRVWYSGFNGEVVDGDRRSPDLTNFAAFSQTVKSRQEFAKCYQAGDPTSRESADIVDTDGGFVRISGASSIIGMVNMESHLLFLASNGIWAITGGSDYGFTPTNYKVTKISANGCISASSIVSVGTTVIYWSEDGIYQVGRDNTGNLSIASVTEKTIQTYYEKIPITSKQNARGVYDSSSKRIRWLFKTGNIFTSNSVTKELILDTTLGSFYPSRIVNTPTYGAEVVGVFSSTPFQRGTLENDVIVGTDSVLVGTDVVSIAESVRQSGVQSVRYILAVVKDTISYLTVGYQYDQDFLDWKSVDGVGVDAKAFLITGTMTGNDSSVAKQIPYLTMHFKRTETGVTEDFIPANQSGCLIRTQWGWSNSAASNKWTSLTQAYRYRVARYVVDINDTYDNGFELISTKTKPRGRGDAFSLYMETEPLKDCRIVGWNISVTGNTKE